MNLKRVGILVFVAGILGMSAANVHADVSAAGVLFLKLPPGARAAAMGESFTAIADDATATHWNPAGLGSSAFSSAWVSKQIPEELRPIKQFTSVKARSGGSYTSYDIWAITAKGLARNDGNDWVFSEHITTRTDQTLSKLVAASFNISNEEDIASRSRKIAELNSKQSYAELNTFFDKLLTAVPETAKQRATLTGYIDTLNVAYDQCLINWSKMEEAEKQFESGMSDGTLSEVETDRVLFSLERGRNRFLPERLEIPFSAGYDGDATVIASSSEFLFLGTTEGFYQFREKRWTKAKSDSTLTGSVQSILPMGAFTLVGFSDGLMKYGSGMLRDVDNADALPRKSVTALGGSSISDIWAVIDNDLYHWNGSIWANWQNYTAVLDDSPDQLAKKFALYGTEAEAALFKEKLVQVNKTVAVTSATDSAAAPAVDSLGVPVEPVTPVEQPFTITAGQVIKVPYVAALKGNVTTLYGSGNSVWLGSNFGLYHFTGKSWEIPGYAKTAVAAGETVQTLVDKVKAKNSETSAQYKEAIKTINDIPGDELTVGDTILTYKTAAAAPVRSINNYEGTIYFATAEGMLQLEDDVWNRSGIQGLGTADALGIAKADNDIWLGSKEKVVARSNARKELAVMHVQLLPGLGVDDVYYEFLSFVTPIEGWGGLGVDVSFLSLGKSVQTGEGGDVISDFYSFETAIAVAYGTSITPSLKGGIAAKVIYSRLSPIGAGKEQGDGTSTGFAVDIGVLQYISRQLTFGAALRNLGPDIAYVDAAQSDPLPRTISLGLAYKLRNEEDLRVLISAQIDKELVALDDGYSKELSQTSPGFGAEVMLMNLIAFRGGYKYDGEDPDNSVATFGAGLRLLNSLKFDFAYTPGFTSEAQKNTLRSSVGLMF